MIEQLQRELKCPVSWETLKNPIDLQPCSHKVSKEAWRGVRQRSLPCPLCRGTILGVKKDALVQQVVKEVFRREQNLKEIQKKLTCPISKTLLTEAIDLQPCAHKVNFSVVQNQVRLCFPCPVCKKNTTHREKDTLIRSLAWVVTQEFLKIEKPKQAVLEYRTDVVYPGARIKWILLEDWRVVEKKAGVVRRLSFRSLEPHAFWERVELWGYEGGSMTLRLVPEKSLFVSAQNYLTELGFISFIKTPGGVFVFSDPLQMQHIYRILEANTILDSKKELFQRLVFAERWQSITPLTEAQYRIAEGLSKHPTGVRELFLKKTKLRILS